MSAAGEAGGVFPAARLQEFAQQLLIASGMPVAAAATLAEHLIWADLRGISWLGVNKIPQYLARLRSGATAAGAAAEVLHDRPGFLVIDGHDGFGQVVVPEAMNLVVGKARSAGVAAGVVRNTTSAGALGYFAMMAARERMIGLAINNSLPLQTAPDAKGRVVGNQAFAIASPAGRHDPLLLDMATSAITWARIHEYARRGQPLPEGVALSDRGEPTADPATALRGILMPRGGYLGFGLALMWEVLTGVLAGGDRFSADVTGPGETSRPQGVSAFVLAIDPAVVMPYESYLLRVDRLIDTVHAAQPAAAGSRVRVPGERSAQIGAQQEVAGIPVPGDLLQTLRELGAELGILL
jgi:LDH2 family malate/lactate/ureidoglycolate dehydrogenase